MIKTYIRSPTAKSRTLTRLQSVA